MSSPHSESPALQDYDSDETPQIIVSRRAEIFAALLREFASEINAVSPEQLAPVQRIWDIEPVLLFLMCVMRSKDLGT